MVKHQQPALDRTFAALADPTRRALLAQLEARGCASVSELAAPLPMSLPAVMKHLDVLSDAGLVTREKIGRVVNIRLNAAPMEDAMAWLTRYQRFWTMQLDRLGEFLEQETCPPKSSKSPMSRQASPSSDATKRRSKTSGRPGRSRKK